MFKRTKISAFLLLFLAIALLSGCSLFAAKPPTNPEPAPPAKPATVEQTLTLYFSDDQAMYLKPESRTVELTTAEDMTPVIATAIVNELIAGPINKDLRPTMPPESKLNSVEIKDKIAYLDFSEEIQTKHGGGSTGEMMTLNSLANSLTELEEIEKIQLLINGKTIESLAGHADTTEPMSRNESAIKK